MLYCWNGVGPAIVSRLLALGSMDMFTVPTAIYSFTSFENVVIVSCFGSAKSPKCI